MISPEEIIDKISLHDNVLGWMATEMHSSATKEMWYPALSTLFVITEQVLKWATDVDDKKTFFRIINLAQEIKLINEEEKQLLHYLRRVRNTYVHANFHAEIFEHNDILLPVNDANTAEYLYEEFASPCLLVILKLVKGQRAR